jgi:hypothetical protein
MPVRPLLHWLREVSGMAHKARVAASARDPWQRYQIEPPLRAFGPGAEDFRGYLARACRLSHATPHDIADFLLQCRYAEDQHLLGEHDHWLHPATFELLRCGDCEDFALWAWRQMVDAGFDTDFVVGIRAVPGNPSGRHAWVTYRDASEEYVLDGVERSLERIIRPLAEVRQLYEPQVGVDAAGRRFVYAGLYRETWGRALRLRERRAQ